MKTYIYNEKCEMGRAAALLIAEKLNAAITARGEAESGFCSGITGYPSITPSSSSRLMMVPASLSRSPSLEMISPPAR